MPDSKQHVPRGARSRPEDVIADPTRPYTGAEYMQSLRDGREVYINGERVADVTTHPALRNSVRSIARLYDGGGEMLLELPRVQGLAQRQHER